MVMGRKKKWKTDQQTYGTNDLLLIVFNVLKKFSV